VGVQARQGALRRGALAIALAAGAAAAPAADRPFFYTDAAVAEEDDEEVFGVEAWAAVARRSAELHAQVEYSIDPRTSVQTEFATRRERRPKASSHSVELEARHLFTDLARDDVGLGVSASVEAEREAEGEGGGEDDAPARWRRGAWQLRGAASVSWGASLLHLNLGALRAPHDKARAALSAALVHSVGRRSEAFVELGGIGGVEHALHGGLRHWLRRERLAVDVTLGRRWPRVDDGRAETFATLGVAMYDVGF
jgi:hypothetical protein